MATTVRAAAVHALPLRIQSLWIAIDTAQVEQILGEREWLKVPAAPSEWPGVLVFQGRAVAVLDLAVLLGLTPLSGSAMRRRTLITKARGCLVAIPVDEIHEAVLITEAQLRPAHATRHLHASYELSIKDRVMPLFDPFDLVSAALARKSAAPSVASDGEPGDS